MIEYALIAGLAVVSVAVVLPRELMPTVSKLFSKVTSMMASTPS